MLHSHDPAPAARRANATEVADALTASRNDTLATFNAILRLLPSLEVQYHPWLNPPLWEAGHIGWFQEYWTTRNSALGYGPAADPNAVRRASLRANADTLYNSSLVPHASRWTLPLPSVSETLSDLAQQLDATLAALARANASDDSLYFFRLALFHEDMHHEAALYMGQALGLPLLDAPGDRGVQLREGARREITVPAMSHPIGWTGAGFAFDNEQPAFQKALPAFVIDGDAVTWADFVPFIEAGGYRDEPLWTEAGWRWVNEHAVRQPRYLSKVDGAWFTDFFGRRVQLDRREPACHLTCHEARAWCRWAGRRLPTEFEWEAAASHAPGTFTCGSVWEWTDSPFAPYAGFIAHPYRDYSAPWFDGRPVLRGGSWATQARMKHHRYRNFFPAERNDIIAGFRSCAL